MSSRPKRLLEFAGEIPDELVRAFEGLLAAGSGWVNLVPEVIEPDDVARVSLLGRHGPTAMGTVMAAHGWRRKRIRLGVMHPQGRITPKELTKLGLAIPEGWRLISSHARKGMVLEPLAQAGVREVLGWTKELCLALCVMETTGKVRAEIYEPRLSPSK